METHLTVEELQTRWETALNATRVAVTDHPRHYRELKAQAAAIVDAPMDINDYFPAVEKLMGRLEVLDPAGHNSIFHIFRKRIAPTTIWQVRTLRMECKDLLAHLEAFDQWRRDAHHLRRIK